MALTGLAGDARTCCGGNSSYTCQGERVYSVARCHTHPPPPPSQLAVGVRDENEIEKSVTREVRSVIRFLNAKNFVQAEIHRKFAEVYGDGAVNEGNVRKCCRLFEEGTSSSLDEERRDLLVTDYLKETANARLLDKRRFTDVELRNIFVTGQSLRGDQEVQEVQGWLKGLAGIFLNEGIQQLVPRY